MARPEGLGYGRFQGGPHHEKAVLLLLGIVPLGALHRAADLRLSRGSTAQSDGNVDRQPEYLSGSALAIGRSASRRPLDGGGGRAHAAERVLHGRDRRRRVEDRELRHHLDADHRRADCRPDRLARSTSPTRTRTSSMSARAARRSDPTSSSAAASTSRPTPGKTWQFVGLRDVGQIGQLKIHPKNPDIAYVAAARQPVRLGTGARRLPHEGRRQDVAEGAVHQRSDRRRCRSRSTGRTRTRSTPAHGARSASRGRSSAAARRAEGGVYKSTDGGDKWTRVERRLPRRSDRQGVGRRRAVEPEGRLRAGRSEVGAKGGLYRSADSGATWTLVNSSQSIRARPFYFNKVFVNPKDENEVYVTELVFHRLDRRRQDVHHRADAARRRSRDVVQPGQPEDLHRDQRRRRQRHAGRRPSWSTQMNQPTAEIYMVDADEQFPYRIYGPQQDNSTRLRRRTCRRRRGRPTSRRRRGSRRRAARAGRSGRRPDGKIVYGDCKGEFARIQRRDRPGAALLDLSAAALRQEPEGHDATASCGRRRSRSTRTTRTVVYHGSQYVHKTIDGGMHWTRFSPDVTANAPGGPRHIGRADHARHDRRGGLRGALLDALVAARAGRLLDRIERRPGVGDARRRQDVEERHAADAAARRPRPHDRGLAAPPRLGVRVGLPDVPERLQAVSLHDERLRPALDAADRRHQRHPGRPADARRARGSGAGRTALRRHARGRVRVVRSGQALAVAAAEPAGDAGHRHQGPPRRSRRLDDGAVVLDHGQRRAAAADRGERDEAVAPADDGQSEWRRGGLTCRPLRRVAVRAVDGRAVRADVAFARRLQTPAPAAPHRHKALAATPRRARAR